MAVRLDPWQNIVGVSWSNNAVLRYLLMSFSMTVKTGAVASLGDATCFPATTSTPPANSVAQWYESIQYGYNSGAEFTTTPPSSQTMTLSAFNDVGDSAGFQLVTVTGKPTGTTVTLTTPGAVAIFPFPNPGGPAVTNITPGARFQATAGTPQHPRANPDDMAGALGGLLLTSATTLAAEYQYQRRGDRFADCYSADYPAVDGFGSPVDIPGERPWLGIPGAFIDGAASIDISSLRASFTVGTQTFTFQPTGSRVAAQSSSDSAFWNLFAEILLEREDLIP